VITEKDTGEKFFSCLSTLNSHAEKYKCTECGKCYGSCYHTRFKCSELLMQVWCVCFVW